MPAKSLIDALRKLPPETPIIVADEFGPDHPKPGQPARFNVATYPVGDIRAIAESANNAREFDSMDLRLPAFAHGAAVLESLFRRLRARAAVKVVIDEHGREIVTSEALADALRSVRAARRKPVKRETKRRQRGPIAPNLFVWPGHKPIELAPIDFRFMDFLWRQPNHRAAAETINDKVWNGSATDGAIRSSATRFNRAILETRAGVEIRTKQGEWFIHTPHEK